MHDPSPENQFEAPRRPSLVKRMSAWAKRLKADIEALASAARDPRVPWPAKLVILLVVAYALSPIDLIPDFIPVIGYLDDVVIVPLGIALAIRLIPKDIMAEHHRRVAGNGGTANKSRTGAAIVIGLWVLSAAFIVWMFV